MTDKDKILLLAMAMEVPTKELKRSIVMGGRRIYFNDDEEIEKILDYVDQTRATEDDVEPTPSRPSANWVMDS